MAIQRTRDIEIDPMFHVPQNVVDVRQQNKVDGQFNYVPGDVAIDPILATPTSLVPMVPTTFSIVDQAVRISADGRSVVDVTIEFPDIAGISSVDVQVSTI
jgi:hypothetical protein